MTGRGPRVGGVESVRNDSAECVLQVAAAATSGRTTDWAHWSRAMAEDSAHSYIDQERPADDEPAHSPDTAQRDAPLSGAASQGSSSTPQLSEELRGKRLAAGKCFNCGERGHIILSCPKSNSVKSDTKGEPPGVTFFCVELGSGTLPAEELRVLADSTTRIEEVEVNFVRVGAPADDNESVSRLAAQPSWSPSLPSQFIASL